MEDRAARAQKPSDEIPMDIIAPNKRNRYGSPRRSLSNDNVNVVTESGRRADKTVSARLSLSVINEALGKSEDNENEQETSSELGDTQGRLQRTFSQNTNTTENRQRVHLVLIRQFLSPAGADTQNLQVEEFAKQFSQKKVLENLFSLFDINNKGQLKQDDWIGFLKSKLNGDQMKMDFAELIESLTYAHCNTADVSLLKFREIIGTNNVLKRLFKLIDRDTTGKVTIDQVMDYISHLTNTRSVDNLTPEDMERFTALFKQFGSGDRILKDDFKKILQTKNTFFIDRIFNIFDRDSSGCISLREFLHGIHPFVEQNHEEKIKFLFSVYDVNSDGLIQPDELRMVMAACMEESGMKFSDQELSELTSALFEDADIEKRGALKYEHFKGQLEKHDGLLENLTISIEKLLKPPDNRETALDRIAKKTPRHLSLNYLRNNYVLITFVTLYLAVNAGLFTHRMFRWRWRTGIYDNTSTDYIVVARAAGQCLNFNCTFIVILMLRQTLTFLRAMGAGSFLPIDEHIYLHRMTGWLLTFFAVMHTAMHLVNIHEGILVANNCTTYVSVLFNPNAPVARDVGLIKGYAFNSGVVLVVILSVMIICALPFVRRRGSFEVFYWTHLLYYPFWVLVIIHATNFWKWFVGPGTIFLLEQAIRFYRWRIGRGRTFIQSGALLPSKVTHLTIERPQNFTFSPGDYVFVRIPKIAHFEWHPFTISSAPEQDDAITLHIRGVGEWTNRLYNYFEKERTKLEAKSKHKPVSGRSFSDPIRRETAVDKDQIELNPQNNGVQRAASVCVRPRRGTLGGSQRFLRRRQSVIAFRVPSVGDSNYSIKVNTPECRDQMVEEGTAGNGSCVVENNALSSNGSCETADQYVGNPLEIFVDGPYGAPSSHIFRAEHAVLIGTGIGVTPFASILQSIMMKYLASRVTCPNCNITWCNEVPDSVFKLKKVDFFWINREQRSFEWFVHLLTQLEIEQAEYGGFMDRFLDMHMYITSALQKTDMKAVGLQLALDLLYEKEKRDLITGLKTRTNAGRPNWNKVFKQLADQKKGRITVFYCGPPQLARTLKIKCDEFGFTFAKESF